MHRFKPWWATRISDEMCQDESRTHCCQKARPRRACVRWAGHACIRRGRSSKSVLALLLACVAASAGSLLPSAHTISSSRWQVLGPIFGDAMRSTVPPAPSPVHWRSLLGGRTMAAASVSPYDSCNITAYREAALEDEDGCFTCVVAWSCSWCYSLTGKGRCECTHTAISTVVI